MKAVILDIDGTLSPEISWQTLTRDLGASVEEELAIFEDFVRGRLTYTTAKRRVVELWAATGNANRTAITTIFEHLPLDPAAGSLVQWLQDEGQAVCLISGSVDLYVQTIAQRLNVPHYFANTELVFDAAGELTDFHYELEQGPKKLDQLLRFCAQQGIHPSDCVVVGDGESELEMFRRTRHGVLLERPGQSTELSKAAWKTVPALSDVHITLEKLIARRKDKS